MFDIYHDGNEIFNKCILWVKISVKLRRIKFGFEKEDN